MPAKPRALAYTNRDTFFLHEGKTKTGKPRYFFAKTIREGAITEMPAGFEVTESVSAVVSVRPTPRTSRRTSLVPRPPGRAMTVAVR